MENGEAKALFAAGQDQGVIDGGGFQPYIDLWQGWDPAVLSDSRYAQTCRVQAEVDVEATRRLLSRRTLPRRGLS